MTYQSRLALFPKTTTIQSNGAAARLTIGGCDLRELAERYGTPLYLYDQATMDGAVAEYRDALRQHYPGASAITLAGKAFMCVAGAQWAQRQQIWLDCTGAGELNVATVARFDRERILVHGVNKSSEDLQAALNQASTIVIDNLGELEQLQRLMRANPNATPELWLRVRPGVAVETHAYRQTGQEDSKFGMSLLEAVEAVGHCQQQGLRLTGLHFHQGSHFHDVEPIGPGLDVVLDLIQELHMQSGWAPTVLSPGGGWGIAYHEDDLPHASIEHYASFVGQRLARGCAERDLPLPRLQVEPGRSLVAQAGVAIYRIGAVKQTANRRWLMIDGGMADNPRKALYGARYSALPVQQPERAAIGPAWIGGPYCESGDVLIEDLPLPALDPGELLAVPSSGAYHLAMGSNYNGARKPAVVWLNAGQATLIQRRETLADLVARDLPLY